ncbi:TIR domain-containing protein [Shewanella baltica]|uniref:TIR domain-containing protein n=1 Tax=Shewanella baltica TaxID=62322 RepID=UPI003D798005
MDNQEIISALELLQNRLYNDVVESYRKHGEHFGKQRFKSWQRQLHSFFKTNLPKSIDSYNQLFSAYEVLPIQYSDSDAEYFVKTVGIKVTSFLESLILDIRNNEYDFTPVNNEVKHLDIIPTTKTKSNKVFIVHGHDGHVKERTARFIERLGFEAIILHEQVSKSRTIIEKIEDYSDVTDFAIVLYTPDDLGVVKTKVNDLQPRARQNVIFEHGFLMGKIGRENVVPLVDGDIELPNDISGIVYVSENWEMKIAQEMQEAGYDIDFNKLLKK